MLQIIKKNAHKSFPQCMRKTLSNDEFVAFIGQGQIKRRVFRERNFFSENQEDWTLLSEGAQENIKVKEITVPCLPINCLISV